MAKKIPLTPAQKKTLTAVLAAAIFLAGALAGPKLQPVITAAGEALQGEIDAAPPPEKP